MPRKRIPGSEEIMRAIRAEMIRRNLAYKDLAKAIGLSESHTSNVCEGWRKAPKAREAIERFFGVPFWSKSNESNL